MNAGQKIENGTDLEISSAALARFALVRKIEESSLCPVENKPTFIPCLETRSHLVQVAAGGRRGQRDVRTKFHLVSGCLDMLAQVEAVTADGQITRQRSLLLLLMLNLLRLFTM